MIDNGRKGKSVGGGLFFSGEMESESLLKNSIKHISKRLPVKFKESEHDELTIYGDISFEELKHKTNIFYIITSFQNKQGNITLTLQKEDGLKSLRLEAENSETKHFVEYKFKNETKLKFVVLVKKERPLMMLWVNGQVRSMKSLKRFKFATIDPNIIIWNKFSQVYIKEACVWQNQESQKIIDEQRRALTI
jgi:hypothetical protein